MHYIECLLSLAAHVAEADLPTAEQVDMLASMSKKLPKVRGVALLYFTVYSSVVLTIQLCVSTMCLSSCLISDYASAGAIVEEG